MLVVLEAELVLPPFPPPPVLTARVSNTAVPGTSSNTSPSAVATRGSARASSASAIERRRSLGLRTRIILTSLPRTGASRSRPCRATPPRQHLQRGEEFRNYDENKRRFFVRADCRRSRNLIDKSVKQERRRRRSLREDKGCDRQGACPAALHLVEPRRRTSPVRATRLPSPVVRTSFN